MANNDTIQKNPVLKPDQDYAGLRQKGLEYIQELGSDLWTDYNEHDPGITILEALTYAITELGYRVSLPMKDLLAGQNGVIPATQTFFTAKHILTQSPLNEDDYRKILIDIPGVHNAWLQPYDPAKSCGPTTAEPTIYADCKADQLTYAQTTHPLKLKGLYQVLLDLDTDPQLGDLNNGEIDLQVFLSGGGGGAAGDSVSFTIVFPSWDGAAVTPNLFTLDATTVAITAVTFTGDGLTMTIAGAGFSVTGTISVGLEPAAGPLDTPTIQGLFTANSNALAKQVLSLYLLKLQRAYNTVRTAIRVLNRHRNLCEDFVTIDTIKDEEIGFCCDIYVAPDADIAEVEAYVLFTIEQYLDPSVNFYLLKEMLAKTDANGQPYTIDEIFEGPRLKHGFIDTTELEKTQLLTQIHASELIARIMDITIDGEKPIQAVQNFRMTAYDDNGKTICAEKNQKWCIDVAPCHKPVLSTSVSKITFYKNQFPYLANPKESGEILEWLESSQARDKLSGQADDLPVPQGNFFPLDHYSSVEYLFPITYGIGKAGLPNAATDDRKAQARQLKAYLLFYDQLLADFLSQLRNAPALFSTDNIVQTYYAQYISDIPDIASIYKGNGSPNLLQTILANQVSTPETPGGWQALYETTETFTDRRNRFLDHLMARFAESFSQYVFLMYSLDYTTQQETKIDPADLIKSKIDFLTDYPRMSYSRARAYDYYPQKADLSLDTTKLWDTDNVAGLEERLCLLGGMSDPAGSTLKSYYRRFLYCVGKASFPPTTDTPPKVQFQFTDPGGDTMISTASYTNQDLATAALPDFLDHAIDPFYYTVAGSGSAWQVVIVDEQGNALAKSNVFTSEPLATAAIDVFVTLFNTECDEEGLHLIEHILLRPRTACPAPVDNCPSPRADCFRLAPVCLDPDCMACGDEDPYTYRISIVLPFWPPHFRNMAFRAYFEDLARAEAPAHVMVKICWINDPSMESFEQAYKAWVTALANYAALPNDGPTLAAFIIANNNLIQLLFSLHSEYPVATLHNCQESGDTNPVVLGKTILGSF